MSLTVSNSEEAHRPDEPERPARLRRSLRGWLKAGDGGRSARAARPSIRPRTARFALGVLLIVLGVGRSWFQWDYGREFPDFLWPYTLSRMVVAGQNGYDRDQRMRTCAEVTNEEWCQRLHMQAYPPATGVVLVPLALLPWPIAKVAWFLISVATPLGGLWYLLRAFVPGLSRGTVALVLGMVACSACVRWGVHVSQPATVVAGVLGIYLAAMLRHRSGLAILCGLVALSLKMTSGLPFIGVAVFQRKWRVLGCFLGLWVAVNLLGAMQMGGLAALDGYRANMAHVVEFRGIDSPDPHVGLVRLDLPYLLNAIHSDVQLSQKLAVLLNLAALLALVYEGWRARAFATSPAVLAAFAAPLSCLSLLIVYHHYYEASLLLPSLLLMAVGPPELRSLSARWCFIVPSALYFGLFTSPYGLGRGQALVGHFLGPGLYVYVKALGCAILVVGFLGSLGTLRRLVERACARTPAPGRQGGSTAIELCSGRGS